MKQESALFRLKNKIQNFTNPINRSSPPMIIDDHGIVPRELSSWLIKPGHKISGFWLDQDQAKDIIAERAGGDDLLFRVGNELRDIGFSIIPAIQDLQLVDQARADYDRYLDEFADKANENRDVAGRQFRLTNFHLYSEAAMKLAKNERIMQVLDFIFGREAAVHTSLTFQYSTMQALHRDAPYFHTFPESQFVGVWTALQNIHPNSGPLSYVGRSHKFEIDQHGLYNYHLESGMSPDIAHDTAHRDYQRLVIETANAIGPRTYAVLNKGDVAIWHPQLVHVGSPALQPDLTRHSMVVHCCPSDLHVYTDNVFFRHQDHNAPAPYYHYATSYGRSHGDFIQPDFMQSL